MVTGVFMEPFCLNRAANVQVEMAASEDARQMVVGAKTVRYP
jgi:hypothetical protein